METSAKKIKSKSRPLTNSEKFLITVLGLILVLWLSFKFVLDPQAARMEELEMDRTLYDAQIAEHNRILRNEENIKDQLQVLTLEKEDIVSDYFPTLDQAQILYLLNDLLVDDRVDTSDMNFSRATSESKGELNIQRMDINIPLNGEYDGVFDTVKALEKSPRKILINGLNLDRDSDEELTGSMSLKIYSLEGLAETDKDIIPIDIFKDGNIKTPFTPYEKYKPPVVQGQPSGPTEPSPSPTPSPTPPSNSGNSDNGKGNEDTDGSDKDWDLEDSLVLLYDFEDENYDFVPYGEGVSGKALASDTSKSGSHSARFEYDILASEEVNGGLLDLSSNNILLKEAPDSIGLWVYSYGYSLGSLGIRLEGATDELIDVELSQDISWLGWSYLETEIPKDKDLYPLKVQGIYYQGKENTDDYGVLLMDKLEAFYEDIEFYVAKKGDSISSISRLKYGTIAYVNEILKLNGMNRNDILPIGKVLVLRKH